jgi:multicomponent Na+:H+ antiporter subunit D
MVFYGIIYALLENDMRRILAYSIVNQVGFMVCGVGIGTQMALNGAAAHAFAHIIYKALLFMSAGAVMYQTGRRKCTDLGGLYRSHAAHDDLRHDRRAVDLGVPAHLGLRHQVADQRGGRAAGPRASCGCCSPRPRPACSCTRASSSRGSCSSTATPGCAQADPPWNMRAAMLLFAAACIVLGCFPGLLYPLLPFPVDYVPYTGAHVVSQLQLLLFAGLAFFVMLSQMERMLTITPRLRLVLPRAAGARGAGRGKGLALWADRAAGNGCGATSAACSGRASSTGSCRTGGWRRPGPRAAWRCGSR